MKVFTGGASDATLAPSFELADLASSSGLGASADAVLPRNAYPAAPAPTAAAPTSHGVEDDFEGTSVA